MSKYVIITPARDEAEYIEETIKSIINQTVKPLEWVIVNDGSSDTTGEIIKCYAEKFSWIKTVHRKDRGYRQAGGGVIEAFYAGYNSIKNEEWDFLVKLDGDLTLPENYFEECFKRFGNNTKLGIAGGGIYHFVNGMIEYEEDPIFHVRGATKIYKRECWNDIGELIRAPGWDTLDEIKANMMGYETRTFPELKLIQHRVTGSADGTWQNWVKNGRANYIAGYHPLFMIFKCFKRTFQKPYFIVSSGLFYGFISGYLQKIPQVSDDKLLQYLRKQQLRRLLLMKSIWK